MRNLDLPGSRWDTVANREHVAERKTNRDYGCDWSEWRHSGAEGARLARSRPSGDAHSSRGHGNRSAPLLPGTGHQLGRSEAASEPPPGANTGENRAATEQGRRSVDCFGK